MAVTIRNVGPIGPLYLAPEGVTINAGVEVTVSDELGAALVEGDLWALASDPWPVPADDDKAAAKATTGKGK